MFGLWICIPGQEPQVKSTCAPTFDLQLKVCISGTAHLELEGKNEQGGASHLGCCISPDQSSNCHLNSNLEGKLFCFCVHWRKSGTRTHATITVFRKESEELRQIEVTRDDVLNLLGKLQANKYPSPVPEDQMGANVGSFFLKKESRGESRFTRPVSLLYFPSKLVETVINDRIMKKIKDRIMKVQSLMLKNQHGFCKPFGVLRGSE